MKHAFVAVLFAAACSDDPTEGPEPADAALVSDAAVSSDAAVPEEDAGVVTACPYGDCSCVDVRVCEDRPALTVTSSLSGEDTANGGYGDCAMSASGSGGRQLYYTLLVPANDSVKVVIRPVTPGTDLLLRELSACGDGTVLASDRGGGLTEGSATLCLNGGGTARGAILAAGIYGGPPTAVFDLSVELVPRFEVCF